MTMLACGSAFDKLRKPLLGFCGFLSLWQLLVLSGRIPQSYFPGIPAIGKTLMTQLGSAEFWAAEMLTVGRSLEGLILAGFTGIAVALLGARYLVVERAVSPVVELFVSVPPAALVPLSIFALGLGSGLYLFIVWFACFWTVYLGAVNALRSSEPAQVHVARSFGYGPWDIMFRIRLPAALPEIATAIRLAAGGSLIATVATEMLAGENGIGYMIYEAAFSLRIPQMFALLAVAGLDGVLLNAFVVGARRTMASWHDSLASSVSV